MIPLGLYGAARPQGGGLALTFIESQSDTVDRTTYTFTINIGAADANRIVVVGIGSRGFANSAPVTSVTINGNAATIDAQHVESSNNSLIARAAVPTGTTATLAFTHALAVRRAGVFVYTINGPVAVTATGGEANNTNDDSMTATLAGAAAGDLIVATAMCATLGGMTWTGVTEDADFFAEVQFSSASGPAAGSDVITTTGPVTSVKTLAAVAYEGA